MECKDCGASMTKMGSYANKRQRMQRWRCPWCGFTKSLPIDGSMSDQVLIDLIEKRRLELREKYKGTTRKIIDPDGNVREVGFDELEQIIDEAIKKVVRIDGKT